ncbi:hypothetical protein OAO87_03500 [bacterium]|nr:hypothetical protein [bacterium]
MRPGEYLFHGADRLSALEKTSWTRFVQSAFKAHAGVAFSPKDCRASFVTFMRDGEHGDEVLRSAAQSMHHSNTMAASAAYDKHGTDRIVAAAVKAAERFAL